MTQEKEVLKNKQPEEPKVEKEVLKNKQPEEPKVEDSSYKAELEKLKSELDNYKEGMLNAKGKLKEKGVEVDSETIQSMVDSALETKLSSLDKKISDTSIDNALNSLVANEDEKELVKYHLENSVKPSGDVKTDIENARLIANKNALYNENRELKATLSAKNSITNSSGGSNTDKPNYSSEVKLNNAEASLLERTNNNRARRGEEALTPEQFINGVS